MTTNCLTQSDPGELEIDGLVGLIGDSFQFLLSRFPSVSSFIVTVGTTVVILGSREILWRGQNC